MYGGMGVCQIEKIGRPDFASQDDDTLYYFLKPVYKNGVFYAPVNNKKISIRKVISKAEAKRLLDGFDEIEGEVITTPSIQQLSQQYQSIIDTHNCRDLLSLTKSIMAKGRACQKNNKKLGQIDKKYMKKAEDLLYGEFAAVLKVDLEKVEEILRDKLEKSY